MWMIHVMSSIQSDVWLLTWLFHQTILSSRPLSNWWNILHGILVWVMAWNSVSRNELRTIWPSVGYQTHQSVYIRLKNKGIDNKWITVSNLSQNTWPDRPISGLFSEGWPHVRHDWQVWAVRDDVKSYDFRTVRLLPHAIFRFPPFPIKRRPVRFSRVLPLMAHLGTNIFLSHAQAYQITVAFLLFWALIIIKYLKVSD